MPDVATDPANPSEPCAPSRLFALKHGDTFVVADAFGDIGGEGDGLFHHDTRLLSRFRLSVGGRPLALLGGAVGQDSVVFTANLTNRPLPPIGGQSTRQGVIHVERTRLIWEDRLYERLRLRNYGQLPTQLPLRLEFAADFRDMFEVRGLRRPARGRLLAAVVGEDSVVLSYEGLDGLLLTSTLAFSVAPARLSGDSAELELALARRPTFGPTSSSRSGWVPQNGRRVRGFAPPPPGRGWLRGQCAGAAPMFAPPVECSTSGWAGPVLTSPC